MKEIYSKIEIHASAKIVWDILMDFADYPNWNPFMKKISGNPKKGSKLQVLIQPPDSRGMLFKPEILEYKPQEKLRWLGKLWIAHLFDGEHSLIIKKINDDKVLFIQKERFTGILVPILGSFLKNSEKGFELMNSALKNEAEKK
jgi:hypothetical protein